MKRDNLPVFDRINRFKRIRLFDGELKPTVEERPSPTVNPYSLRKRVRHPRPYLSPTGEIVWRLRGGKGFTRVYEKWDPSKLLRVRGRMMPVPKVVEIACGLEARCDKAPDINYASGCACGRPVISCRAQQAPKTTTLARTVEWVAYPCGWGAVEPDPGPHVLRAAAELAAAGADIRGCNLPGVREYVESAKRFRRLAETETSLGPKLDEAQEEIFLGSPPHSAEVARALHRLELQERKHFARHERAWVPGMPLPADSGRKVNTSEYRNETTGEYGAESRMGPDGQIIFGKRAPLLKHNGVRVRGIKDYVERARDGQRRYYRQKAVSRLNKPGPKPKYGQAMSARIRKAKERCAKRGIPFVIQKYLQPKRKREEVL